MNRREIHSRKVENQNAIEKRFDSEGKMWLEGIVTTPHGYVYVYSRNGTIYQMFLEDRIYTYSSPWVGSKAALSRRANKFAREVFCMAPSAQGRLFLP